MEYDYNRALAVIVWILALGAFVGLVFIEATKKKPAPNPKEKEQPPKPETPICPSCHREGFAVTHAEAAPGAFFASYCTCACGNIWGGMTGRQGYLEG
jgi:hypothetical protein